VSDGAFSRRGAGLLAAAAAASLAAAGFLGAFGDALYDPPSAGADSFSRSAVGHRAFVELLRGLGQPVVISRHRTADKAGEGAVVALLEPGVGPEDGTREGLLETIDDAARRMLVVLPKRRAVPDPTRPRWVADAQLLPELEPQRVLDALSLDAKVVRPQRSITSWKRKGGLPAPEVEAPQLVTSAEDLAPLVWTDEGVLVGERAAEGWTTIVVADPDVLATHGLARGDNAALALALLARLGAPDRPIVVDETLHGFDQQPSIARELLRMPLLPATVAALLAAALLAWAALVRFGRPRPAEPPLAAGKLFLVESTAALLRHGGDVRHAAESYLKAAKDAVAHRLRPPGETAQAEAWLARTAAARGQGEALQALEARVGALASRRAEEEAVRAAQAIHAWREEMTDGAERDPRAHRPAQG
jgi:uncharacterized protein DUF4350